MREEVISNPELFDPNAQERIDKAIEEVRPVRLLIEAEEGS
jgi:hypothetical protein